MNVEEFTDVLINIGTFARLMIVAVVLFIPSFVAYMVISA